MANSGRLMEQGLRLMSFQDLPQVMEIELKSYPYPWTTGIFRDCLRAGYSCWILEAPALGPLGYGVMSVAAGECHLLNLTIRPESQGQGHGRMLLRELLDLATRDKAEIAFLEVRPSNAAALALYRSEGFSEVGLRRKYYPAATGREDALVMARQLY